MDNIVSIPIELRANNSSGEQTLHFTGDDEQGLEFWFTLTGHFNGKQIQIDFDSMTRGEVEEMRMSLDLILDEFK